MCLWIFENRIGFVGMDLSQNVAIWWHRCGRFMLFISEGLWQYV